MEQHTENPTPYSHRRTEQEAEARRLDELMETIAAHVIEEDHESAKRTLAAALAKAEQERDDMYENTVPKNEANERIAQEQEQMRVLAQERIAKAEQERDELREALVGLTAYLESPWDVDQDCRFCGSHYEGHAADCVWARALQATQEDDSWPEIMKRP